MSAGVTLPVNVTLLATPVRIWVPSGGPSSVTWGATRMLLLTLSAPWERTCHTPLFSTMLPVSWN